MVFIHVIYRIPVFFFFTILFSHALSQLYFWCAFKNITGIFFLFGYKIEIYLSNETVNLKSHCFDCLRNILDSQNKQMGIETMLHRFSRFQYAFQEMTWQQGRLQEQIFWGNVINHSCICPSPSNNIHHVTFWQKNKSCCCFGGFL